MSHIPQKFIEEVLSKTDIYDVISSTVELKKQGSRYFGLCPFHGEKTPSFCVSRSKQLFYCFGCHVGGNVINFLEQYENETFKEAIEDLAGRLHMSVPYENDDEESRARASLRSEIFEANKEAANYYYMVLRSSGGRQALDYLHGRGLTDETILKFGLGYSPPGRDSLRRYLNEKGFSDGTLKESGLVVYSPTGEAKDRFFDRVMFPIQDVNRHVIGFGGRIMGDGNPKYLNTSDTVVFDKSRNLYGLHLARKSGRSHMILCEGYMDVIAMHQAGFDSAVASLGTALTPGHAALIKKYADDNSFTYLCYDSDSAGVKAALRAMPILKGAGLDSRIISMEPYKDPDEFIKNLGAEAFEERIGQAKNGFVFSLDVLERSYDMDDPQGRTECINEAAVRIAGIHDEIERGNYVKYAAERYDVDIGSLRKKILQIAMEGKAVSQAVTADVENEVKYDKRTDDINRPQGIIICAIAQKPDIAPIVEKYIGLEDFEEGLYRTLAKEVLEQAKQGEIKPHVIISRFDKDEDRAFVSAVFEEDGLSEMSDEELTGAVREALYKIAKKSLDISVKSGGTGSVNEVVEKKKILQQIPTLKF